LIFQCVTVVRPQAPYSAGNRSGSGPGIRSFHHRMTISMGMCNILEPFHPDFSNSLRLAEPTPRRGPELRCTALSQMPPSIPCLEKKPSEFDGPFAFLTQPLPYPLTLSHKPQYHGAVFLLTYKANFPTINLQKSKVLSEKRYHTDTLRESYV
jgi:hypothetical protein